jgi:sugar-specific transcriptional regulator TrmB
MHLSQILDNLKLTKYEKEAILFLSSVDVAEAKQIYKKTTIPKGKIYFTLEILANKGIVQIIPMSPKKYQIKNIKKSLEFYIKQKEAKLEEKRELVSNLTLKPKTHQFHNTPSVQIFTGREEHLNILASARESTKKKILQISPLFIGTYSSNKSLYNALDRGVKLKVITLKVRDKNKKHIQTCIDKGAKIRFLNSPELFSCAILDQKEFLLGVQDHTNKEKRLTMLSRNRAILKVLNDTY